MLLSRRHPRLWSRTRRLQRRRAEARARLRRRLTAPVLATGAVLAAVALAAVVNSTNPFWLTEDFTSTADLDSAQTTACVDTAAPGTLTLCAPGAHAAVDPASSRYVLAGGSAVKHFAFDGAAMRDVTAAQGPAASGAVDADWVADGRLVLASAAGFTDYAPDATGKLVPVPGAAVTGLANIVGVAGAPGRRWLLDSGGGVTGWGWTGSGYAYRPDWDLGIVAGATRIRVSRAGAWLAIRLQDGTLRIYAWSGSGWVYRPGMAPPAGVSAADMAFFPDGSGYWTLSAGGQLRAWGYTGSGVTEITGLAITVSGAAALAPGFGGKDALAVTGAGATYVGVSGDASRTVAGYSVSASGLGGGGYASPGVATSRAFALDHSVDMVALEVTQTLPASTSTAWEVSTDGGATWTPLPLTEWSSDNGATWQPAGTEPQGVQLLWRSGAVAVPAGSQLAWRGTLATADAAVTPAVDKVEVFEVAEGAATLGQVKGVLTQ